MKKTLLVVGFLLVSFCATAQNLTEYRASNGINYHLKDTVKLGLGSGSDGIFKYLLPGGLESISKGEHSADRVNMKNRLTNAAVIIKKIKKKNINGIIKYTFVVTGGYSYPFDLSIEEAIQTCEVLPCATQTATK